MNNTIDFDFLKLKCKLKGTFKFNLNYYKNTLQKLNNLSDKAFIEIKDLFRECEKGLLFEGEFYDRLDIILRKYGYLNWHKIPTQ